MGNSWQGFTNCELCLDVRLVPVRRGRFALELDCALELVERESG